MKKLIIPFFVFVFLAVLVSAIPIPGKSYSLSLHYKEGSVTVTNATFLNGYAPERRFEPIEAYKFVLFDHKGKELFATKFVLPTKLEVPMGPGGKFSPTYVPQDDFDYGDLVPYYTEGKEIELYDPTGKKITSIDVSRYAYCNQDSKCSDREESDICPEDCKSGEKGLIRKYLDGEKLFIEEIEKYNLPPEPKAEAGSWWWVFVLFIVVIGAYLWLHSKKKK